MSLREALNKKPALTGGVMAVIVAAAIAVAVGTSASYGPRHRDKAFYSVDDGQTWFVDDVNKVPPFEHDGKQAVRARVFTSDGGKTSFVGYLERYTPEAKKLLESALAQAKQGKVTGREGMDAMLHGTEVKKPGATKWVKRSDPSYGEVLNVKCKTGTPEVVLP
jgi:hypothetical protein